MSTLEKERECRKLAKLLETRRITFEEYAYNLTLAIVSGLEDDIPDCVKTIPPELADAYAEYLRTTVESVDFMPSPTAFLVGPYTEEKIEQRKRELRPRYLRLHQLMNQMVAEPTTVTGSLGGPSS
jgi:hypothetical protein